MGGFLELPACTDPQGCEVAAPLPPRPESELRLQYKSPSGEWCTVAMSLSAARKVRDFLDAAIATALREFGA